MGEEYGPCTTTFTLVHSPLLGPASWQPVAAELRARGHEVAVPSLVDAFSAPPPWYPPLAAAAGAAAGSVVVAHSAAGALVPSILAAGPAVAVFVDAVLPHPGRSRLDTLPPALVDRLRAVAGPDGLLPPWPEWFPPEVVAEILPDPAVRAAAFADVPRVPLAWLAEPAPRLPPSPGRYLQLSEAYRDDADGAGRAGWPVARLPGHHLSTVTDPAAVVDALLALST